MINKKIFIHSLIVSLTLFSCIKEIGNPDFPNEQKIVVNGFLCPDSLVRVHVSLSQSMGEQAQEVAEAVLTLYEDGAAVGVFQYLGEGWYLNPLQPNVNKEYKIVVSLASYPTVHAQTRIPALPQQLSGTYFKTSNIPVEDASGIKVFPTQTKIEFDDPIEELNFYEWGSNMFQYEISQETDPSLLSDGDLSYNPSTYYCSDNLFNGTHKTVLLQKGGQVFLNFGTIFFDANYQKCFKSCSSEYYQFRKSWTKHLYNQQNNSSLDDPVQLLFLGDPVTLYSNVIGGYGVFAGYNAIQLPVIYVE